MNDPVPNQNEQQFATPDTFSFNKLGWWLGLGGILVTVAFGSIFFITKKREYSSASNYKVKQSQELIQQEISQLTTVVAEKREGDYFLWCVASQDMVKHQPPIMLPMGDEITHSIPCQYVGPEGQLQTVLIPALSFNQTKQTYQILGRNPVKPNNFTAAFESFTEGEGAKLGPLGALKNGFDYTGAGHIMLIFFTMPDGNEAEEFLPEEINQLWTPELLNEFARTGNPDLLPHQLLFPEGEPFHNRLNLLQKMKAEDETQ